MSITPSTIFSRAITSAFDSVSPTRSSMMAASRPSKTGLSTSCQPSRNWASFMRLRRLRTVSSSTLRPFATRAYEIRPPHWNEWGEASARIILMSRSSGVHKAAYPWAKRTRPDIFVWRGPATEAGCQLPRRSCEPRDDNKMFQNKSTTERTEKERLFGVSVIAVVVMAFGALTAILGLLGMLVGFVSGIMDTSRGAGFVQAIVFTYYQIFRSMMHFHPLNHY